MRRFIATGALAIALCPSLLAQRSETPPEVPESIDGVAQLAPVVIDGNTLFAVRGVTAYPAERRAREIAARIEALAANPEFSPSSLTLEEQSGGTAVLANGRRILMVLDEDAIIERTERVRLAEIFRDRIAEAIQEYRNDRNPRYLIQHALYGLGVTVILLCVAVLGRRIVEALQRLLENRYRRRVEGLQETAFHVVKADQVWRALAGFLNTIWAVVIVLMLYAYLNYVLALFPWTQGLAKSLFAIALDPLKTIGMGIVGMIPNLVFLAVLAFVMRHALKVLRILFDGLANGSIRLGGFYPEWAWPTYRLVRVLLILLAVVVAYPYIPGSGSEAFKGVSLFVGIIFSLGSSSLIGNFIAGYSMTYRRTFRIGDRVKIGQYLGTVEHLQVLVTRMRTIKNEEIIVPNSMILASEVINYSSLARERGLVLHTVVGIGYETPWRQVEAMLLQAAAATDGLLREPAPFVWQKELADFAVNYELNVYCDRPDLMEVLYSGLHRNIQDVFNRYGVQIMTPSYRGDPADPKIVPIEHWYDAPAKPPEPTAPTS